MVEWTWIPDQDGTPENPVVKPSASKVIDVQESRASAPGATGDTTAVPAEQEGGVYSADDLARWKPGQLKELLTSLGLDASGCTEKRDIVDKIMRHPRGPAAAAAAATARGETIAVRRRSAQSEGQKVGVSAGTQSAEDTMAAAASAGDKEQEQKDGEEQEEEGEDFVGMTLADYMGRPTEEDGVNNPGLDGRGGGGRPGGVGPGDRGRGGGGRPRGEAPGGRIGDRNGGGRLGYDRPDRARPTSVSGSASGGREDLSSAASGRGGKVVRLAPAHIAPPSRPAPEWVIHMQVRRP